MPTLRSRSILPIGAAHVARIEALIRAGRKDELPAALAAAKPANFSDVERARLEALVADTPKERTKALLGLARATRFDLQIWRTAGEAALVSKDHATAIEAFQKALTFDPANVILWNTLAYAQAFTGDVESARNESRRIPSPSAERSECNRFSRGGLLLSTAAFRKQKRVSSRHSN